jgi:uncharacterized lipoprotein
MKSLGIVVASSIVALTAGCGLFRPDQSCHKAQAYESSKSVARLKVPPGMDAPDTGGALVVPPVDAPEAPRSRSHACLDEPPRYRSDAPALPDARSESPKDDMKAEKK